MKDKSPQKIIRDSKWYFKPFDRDSTICAMLTMLDAIHERYMSQEKRDLFGNLKRLQFYVKSLGLYNLSEELYIKMNARGLQLSPLENFKADLTHFISNEKRGIFKERVPLYKKDANDKVLFSFNFSVKLDTKWVDIFWRKGSEDFDATICASLLDSLLANISLLVKIKSVTKKWLQIRFLRLSILTRKNV